jgi:tyrosyl-tRNA synthetase
VAAAEAAQSHFKERFAERKVRPEELPEHRVAAADAAGTKLVDALASTLMASSKGEARRLIGQNAVEVNGTRVSDLNAVLPPGTHTVKVGKLKLARLTVA